MLNVNTDMVARLKANDASAWYELWEVFGPSIERIVASIANRYFGQETIKDVGQETLACVYKDIGRFDPARGVKFSTWLYSIARHIVLTEMTRRNAQKRNSGEKPASLDAMEGCEPVLHDPPAGFETGVFRDKVLKAMRDVEARTDVLEFEAYRIKLLRGVQGKDIAAQLGVSEASASRYLKHVRDEMRREIARAVAQYSWTSAEESDVERAGLDKAADDDFDDALANVFAAALDERKNRGVMANTARAAIRKI